MTKQEKEEYSSQTIQGLNERVAELEKELADLKKLIYSTKMRTILLNGLLNWRR